MHVQIHTWTNERDASRDYRSAPSLESTRDAVSWFSFGSAAVPVTIASTESTVQCTSGAHRPRAIDNAKGDQV
jgi:hypothetical protein